MAIGPNYGSVSLQGAHSFTSTIEAEPAREAQVPEEQRLLREAVDDLCSEIDALPSLLATVTSPMPASASDSPPDTACVTVASEIRTQRRRVQAATDLLRRLTSSLEL